MISNEKPFSLPSRQQVDHHVYKYNVGDKVRNVNAADWNKHYGKHGVVTKILPFGTVYPAYDILYDDSKTVATSERSIDVIRE